MNSRIKADSNNQTNFFFSSRLTNDVNNTLTGPGFIFDEITKGQECQNLIESCGEKPKKENQMGFIMKVCMRHNSVKQRHFYFVVFVCESDHCTI